MEFWNHFRTMAKGKTMAKHEVAGRTILKGWISFSPGLPALRSQSSEALLAKEDAFLPSVGLAKEGDEGGRGYPGITGQTTPALKGLHQVCTTRLPLSTSATARESLNSHSGCRRFPL